MPTSHGFCTRLYGIIIERHQEHSAKQRDSLAATTIIVSVWKSTLVQCRHAAGYINNVQTKVGTKCTFVLGYTEPEVNERRIEQIPYWVGWLLDNLLVVEFLKVNLSPEKVLSATGAEVAAK